MAKILVVDDEKLIVKGIRFSLEQDGMEAVSYTHLDVYKRQESYGSDCTVQTGAGAGGFSQSDMAGVSALHSGSQH